MKTVKRIIRAILRRVHFVSLNVWIPIRRTWTKEPKRFCIACGRNVPRFLPYRGGTTPGFIDAVAVVGSDVQNFSCPRCWSHDRERHLLLFFEAFELRPKVTHKRVLHFAPEHSIRKLVESCGPSE